MVADKVTGTITLVIGRCPRDGRNWDCQCARCGSSCDFHDCDNCGGDGEIEDEDWQFEGEFHRCDWCHGSGGHWACLSSPEYCEANPADGRADVRRGTVEWFTFEAPKATS